MVDETNERADKSEEILNDKVALQKLLDEAARKAREEAQAEF